MDDDLAGAVAARQCTRCLARRPIAGDCRPTPSQYKCAWISPVSGKLIFPMQDFDVALVRLDPNIAGVASVKSNRDVCAPLEDRAFERQSAPVTGFPAISVGVEYAVDERLTAGYPRR